MTDHTILNEALPLWLKLRGVNPDASPYGSFAIADYEARREAQEISEAIAIEPTELTGQMMLGHFLNAYEKDTKFTLHDLLHNPARFTEQATLCRQIRAILERDELVNDRLAFAVQLDKALAQYGASAREDIQDILVNDDALALLRRDAFKSAAELQVAQFLQGAKGPSTRPGYSTVLRQWWNINSLLEAAVSLPDGVSLHLINAPSGFESYFVFLVRRGANLYILNDAPQFAHPLQGQMSRRPDRSLAARAARNWFPYELMGLAYDDRGEAYIHKVTSTALVPGGVAFQGQTSVLRHINELPAAELIWTTLMFDLIMDRFWIQELPALPMSYTAQMLKQEGALIENAQKVGLPVVAHARPSVAVPELSLADVATLHTRADATTTLGDVPDHPFAWMEARYSHTIPADAFNLVASDLALARLTRDGAGVELIEAPQNLGYFEKRAFEERTTALHTLASSAFGTAEQLKADRAFLARKNYADLIQKAANAEFDARGAAIEAWYTKAITARLPFLTRLAGHGLIMIQDRRDEGHLGHGFRRQVGRMMTRLWDRTAQAPSDVKGLCHALMETQRLDDKDSRPSYARNIGPARLRGHRHELLCVHHHTVASSQVVFSPTNATEMAWLLGMAVSELPDVLQHFTLIEPNRGNCILDRIDPMAWALHNPWVRMDFNVRLGLSKRGAKLAAQDLQEVDYAALDFVNGALINADDDAARQRTRKAAADDA